MGICCSSESDSKKNKQKKLILTKSTIREFRKNYYKNQPNNSNLPSTTETSKKKKNYIPEIYSLNKYGIQIKTNQKFSSPLKFVFNLSNFKGKMLSENTLYILHIMFDGKDFPMSFGKGNNPNFVFNQTFIKEISFEKMSTSFLEIYLYTYKSSLNDKRNLDLMTKGEILSEAQIFSCFKMNLLTLVFSPEKHDFALIDPQRKRVKLGRISYCVSCKHIEDVNIKIKKFKINLNNLKYDEIALKLKLENRNMNREKESEYTQNLIGEPNDNKNSMMYEYPFKIKEELLIDNISESITLTNERNSKLFDNKNNEIEEKLNIHGKMSMMDLFNSETTLNLYSVRLQKKEELNSQKNKFFMKKLELPQIAKMSYRKNNYEDNQELVKSYTLIGVIFLNFNKILNDLEEKLAKIGNRLFSSMSNKKSGLLKTLSGSKILKDGIEEDLTNKVNSNQNLANINIEQVKYKTEIFFTNILANEHLNITENIFWEGDNIGTIEITLDINNLPLIRQTRFGVMTETGFALTSIFLYENLNLSNDLPVEILELNKLKEIFELDFSNLKKIKACLEKSIDDYYLYYGYSSNKDLYQSQAIIIDLGLGLFELLDKMGFEYLHITFEILKLILKRAEFDLGTLSRNWFKKTNNPLPRKNSDELQLAPSKTSFFNYESDIDSEQGEFEFWDNDLIKNKIIEKYLNFHSEILYFCLNNLNKGKNINKDSMDFTYFYLSIAFFQNPHFRNSFVNAISNNIDLNDKKYTKYLKFINNYSREDSSGNNNFILWDNLFYQRLESAIRIYNEKIKRKVSENSTKNIRRIPPDDNNISDERKLSDISNNITSKIENINLIKEQLMNIKYMTQIKEEKNMNKESNIINSLNKSHWYTKLNKRDYIFYDFILHLFEHINELRNKFTTNYSSNLNFKNTQKILNFNSLDKIIKIIAFDLATKKAKDYPKQIKDLIPKFYAEPTIINNFIYIMLTTTNVYDTLSIFNVLEILDNLFNKIYEYDDFRIYLKNEIDFYVMKRAFLIIVESDNSLAIAKFLWFYYKNNSLINLHHIGDIIKCIISNFFKFFFHWSFQIREIFYFFITFILGHKLKNRIKSKSDEKMLKKIEKNFKNQADTIIILNEFNKNKNIGKNEFFFVQDELNENIEIIAKLQNIIKKENFQEAYMDNVININDPQVLNKIPKESHGNIIECLRQYNSVVTKFGIWEKNIEENLITEDKIEYPQMEISIIKDDKIQYDSFE